MYDILLAQRYFAPGETTRDDVYRRVARALARAELPEHRVHHARCFYANMLRGAIGAGRIMANAGTHKSATMINCFVHPIVSDEDATAQPRDILFAVQNACRTLRMGGGVGYDFSSIAPSNALESNRGEAGASTGDVCAVIEQFDRACRALLLPDTRGGAQMAVLRCDHPDLEAFIDAKRGRRRWGTFNVSVAITDAFMHAVVTDAEWQLQHRATPDAKTLARGAHRLVNGNWCYATVSARHLWYRIAAAAHDSAEPGLLFIDTIRRADDLADIEQIAATNPCGEQPLPPWGSCVLGPIDLSRNVRHPFGVGGKPVFDFAKLGRLVRVQVRMLDNAIDVTQWPMTEQGVEARSKRRIGVGVAALGDALTMMCLRYDSQAARHLASDIGRCLRDNAYMASAMLAGERGSYPLFRIERSLSAGHFASALPRAVRDLIGRQGLRNSHLLSIAPTGSVSLAFFSNCSSGVEPAFDWEYQRRMRLNGEPPQDFRLRNHALLSFRRLCGKHAALPDYFVTAGQIEGSDHLKMVAALQPFIDGGISKTVLLSKTTSVKEVGALFEQAWRAGLKGVTVFRPDDRADAVLHTVPSPCGSPGCADVAS
nr:adenosylcobalamin-dependent ribonucleoside-diphosphate reductase [Pandoraea capi]